MDCARPLCIGPQLPLYSFDNRVGLCLAWYFPTVRQVARAFRVSGLPLILVTLTCKLVLHGIPRSGHYMTS